MKTTHTLAVALALACLCVTDVLAGCNAPIAPSRVPDGATASEAEMLAAMQTLRRYDGDVSAYVKCLEFEVKRQRLTSVQQARLHNAAIDQLQQIADRFNDQLLVFKTSRG